MIGVKVTEEEFEALRLAAFEARKAPSAFLRDLGLAAAAKKKR